MGEIRVNLSEDIDLDDLRNMIDFSGRTQLRLFKRLGNLSNLENAVSNIVLAVDLTFDGHPYKPMFLWNLGNSQRLRFECLGDLSALENAISNFKKAVELTDYEHPSKPMYISSLGDSQGARFRRFGALSDVENAISNIEEAVQLTGGIYLGDSLAKPTFLSYLGTSQDTRFRRLGELSDLESAISNLGKAVELLDDGIPDKADLSNLGNSLHARFQRLSNISDLENAISNHEKAVNLIDDSSHIKPKILSSLGSSWQTCFEHLGDLSDLENAISNHERAVELTDDNHPNKASFLSNLGNSQILHFKRLDNFSDLANSISNTEMAIKLTDDSHPDMAVWLSNLGRHNKYCFEHLHEPSYLMTCISSFKAASQLPAAYPSQALFAARQWGTISHLNGDLLSALDGYKAALGLMPKVAWLGLNASSRHDKLLQEKSENLGCLAANCAIQLGHLEEAVELLNQGRSVLWQQASSLRSDLEALREEEPELAEELEKIGQQLDAGNFSDTFFTLRQISVDDDQHKPENIGKERHHLAGVWEGLLERVRQLPKFEYFLKPIPFHQFRQAFTAGQVVIINASEYGVDALIFAATGPIKHVSLPDINFETFTKLSANMALMHSVSASAVQKQNYITRFLKPGLRTVWNDILTPIFDNLHIPSPATEFPAHRIWWYPTGPLISVPIHAAGPGSGAIDVSRLVISSYVTTLQSLVQAHMKNAQHIPRGKQKLLSISQQDTPGQSSLPKAMGEVDGVVHVFVSSGWPKENVICLGGPEATVNCVSNALDSCSWVHFACHGFQDSKLGMKSAFALHDGNLELSEIASKKLTNGRLAFLSACHAASGLKDLPGEAIHLAGGLQFAGFPSVVATMWKICDEDAPNVAVQTYQYLFRNGQQGPDPSEAATALNRAVLCLREDPNITVDRWAPFVHFGI
jgi:tetratricopeptide (TPR) repeat protein